MHDNDNYKNYQNTNEYKLNMFARKLSAAITLVGGEISKERIKKMTLEELWSSISPNGLKLSFKFTKDIKDFEF